MSYYPTLSEDIKRAKEILAKGRPLPRDYEHLPEPIQAFAKTGGTIFGADVYAAYRLLESFVEAIEAVDPKVCELALRVARKSHP